MAKTFTKQLLLMGFLCLLQPAFASNPPSARQLEIKQSLFDDTQERIDKLSAQITVKEREKKQIEMDIKQFTFEVKRLRLNTHPDTAEQKKLDTAEFEIKRAEFNLDKNTKILQQLNAEKEKTREEKRLYSLQVEELKNQLAGVHTTATASNNNNADGNQAEKKLAAEKAHQAELDKIRQQEAVRVEKQRSALQQKLGAVVKPTVVKPAIPEKAKAAPITPSPAEKTRLANIAKDKQIAAEKERLRLIELEKQQALAAQQAENEKIKKEQSERTRAAQVAKQAEESAQQVQALTEKKRLSQLEQERLRVQAQKETTIITESGINQAVNQNTQSGKALTPQQATQVKLLETSTTLPPAESALTLAMARSLDAASEQPNLGDNPKLEVANPIGSKPMLVGTMKYLGNNQYMLELRVAKGKQEFLLGQYNFIKNIPEHFDGIRCLLLVDARNKNKPVFQLVVSGG